MLPLQHAGLWRGLSVLILILVLLMALSPAMWLFDDRASALAWFENVDKWLHAITFIVLSLWFTGLVEKRRWWLVAVGLMLFGFMVEGGQLLVSYRTADWLDIGANTIGIIVGLAVAAAGLGGWGLRVEHWYSQRRPI